MSWIVGWLAKQTWVGSRVKKLGSGHVFFGSGRVRSQKTRVWSRVNPFFIWLKKIKFGLGIFGSGQKILTHFVMSTQMSLENLWYLWAHMLDSMCKTQELIREPHSYWIGALTWKIAYFPLNKDQSTLILITVIPLI